MDGKIGTISHFPFVFSFHKIARFKKSKHHGWRWKSAKYYVSGEYARKNGRLSSLFDQYMQQHNGMKDFLIYSWTDAYNFLKLESISRMLLNIGTVSSA